MRDMCRTCSGGRPMRTSHRTLVGALATLALAAGLAGCGSGSQSDSSGSTITVAHGYTDVEAKALKVQEADVEQGAPRLEGAVRVQRRQRLGAAEDRGRVHGRQLPGRLLPVRLVRGDARQAAEAHRPDRPGRQEVVRLAGLLPLGAAGGDRRRQGRRRAGAGRQPQPRLQQDAVPEGRRGAAQRLLDLGGLPEGGGQADRPVDQDLRLGLRQRRQRGHRLALPRPAVAGGR